MKEFINNRTCVPYQTPKLLHAKKNSAKPKGFNTATFKQAKLPLKYQV